MSIPSPKDVDYNNDVEFNLILETIADLLRHKQFTFKPQPDWEKFLYRLQMELFKSGWDLQSDWSGQPGDATFNGWKLTPANLNGR